MDNFKKPTSVLIKKSILSILSTFFMFLIFSSCQTKPTSSDTTLNKEDSKTLDGTSSWPNRMQQLTYHISELLPIITNPKNFSDVKNKNLVENRITTLKTLAHEINQSTTAPDQDPTLKLIGSRFEDNLKLSLESYQSGHIEFSRSVLKNSLAQCVQCHTRLSTGPTLEKPQFLNSLEKISIVERVQFLIASRYFDEAMLEINNAIDKNENLSIVAWQKLVQLGLIINVRFRHDVKVSNEFVNRLGQNKNLPFFIKRHIPFWEASIKDWQRNPNPNANLKAAQQIVGKAEQAQKASRSEGGTIDFLRAGSLLHQFLSKTQVPSAKSEALYQLGLIYENIGEIGAWSMNEDYYELCIRTLPHSEMAKKCFARFQESTIAGFSGTGGLYIPDDIQNKMNELRAVAL